MYLSTCSLIILFLVAFARVPFPQVKAPPPNHSAPSTTRSYDIKYWVIRPVAKHPVLKEEMEHRGEHWQFIRLSSPLAGTASNPRILSTLRKENASFRFDSVIESKTVPVTLAVEWTYRRNSVTRFQITVPDKYSSNRTPEKDPSRWCRVDARFAPEPGPADSKDLWLEQNGNRFNGRFEIPPNRIVVFNGGQANSLGEGIGSDRRYLHEPRDLLLLAIRRQGGEGKTTL